MNFHIFIKCYLDSISWLSINGKSKYNQNLIDIVSKNRKFKNFQNSTGKILNFLFFILFFE